MKIGVYGDSFCHYCRSPDGSEDWGWPGMIATSLNADEIDCYARGGSGIEFSYLNFIKTHEQYDLIIFVCSAVTRTGLISRKYKEDYIYHTSIHPYIDLNYNLNLAIQESLELDEYYFSRNDTFRNTKILNKMHLKEAINCEMSISRLYPGKNDLAHNAIRDSIKFLRPDAIIIEAFDTFDNYGKLTLGMININTCDRKQYSDDWHIAEDHKVRRNHLTHTQNVEFARYLKEQIATKKFNIHETFKDPKQYYTMSSSIEESGFLKDTSWSDITKSMANKTK